MIARYSLSDIMEYVGGLGVLAFIAGVVLALIGAGLRFLNVIDTAMVFLGLACILIGIGLGVVAIAFIVMWRDEGW